MSVCLFYGYKIPEKDLIERMQEIDELYNFSNSESTDSNTDNENGDFDMYEFQTKVNNFLKHKYVSKIECDMLKCCPHKKISDWIIGIAKKDVDSYTLEGFNLTMPTEDEIADLKIVKRVLKIKDKTPKWYVISYKCWTCT